jgi:hypothetical protein
MDGEAEPQLGLVGIFFPWARRQFDALRERNGKLAHYTTAEVALSIIQNRRVWMRNAQTMNDFSEIEHGKFCLFTAYQSDPGQKLQAVLERVHPGFCKDLGDRFNSWLPAFENDTFLTCFSEHSNDEDKLGRLSMWRAYGRSNGVALILNNRPFVDPSDALRAYTSPVAYFSQAQFHHHFYEIAAAAEANEAQLANVEYETLMGQVFTAFRFAILCTKHPGFHEEREWRVVYGPSFEKSPHIEHCIEVIGGVPQKVCKIPLKNIPDEEFLGAELIELLDKIIIGPTDHGPAIYQAFCQALEEAGIQDPSARVVVSDIPLRSH